jgi:hypothetical protein
VKKRKKKENQQKRKLLIGDGEVEEMPINKCKVHWNETRQMKQQKRQEREYEIERLMDETNDMGKTKILVKWVGYKKCTWEPVSNFKT